MSSPTRLSQNDMSEANCADNSATTSPKEDSWCSNLPPEDSGSPDRWPPPAGLTPEGRLVWEPPTTILHWDLISEEYAMMRKAVSEFTDGDPAQTTEYLDWEIETVLNERYED